MRLTLPWRPLGALSRLRGEGGGGGLGGPTRGVRQKSPTKVPIELQEGPTNDPRLSTPAVKGKGRHLDNPRGPH
eukprot:340949-Pyramimonas_sp.AAC.1